MCKKLYWPEIDGLRFLAFLLVFIHHFRPADSHFLKCLNEIGWIGVDLFFFLSAFLLTKLLKKEYEQSGKINIPYFFIRRLLRIWPLYFFYLSYILVSYYFLFKPDNDVCNRVFSLLFFFDNWMSMNEGYNFIPGTIHLWSISMEEQFYLILPIILPFFFRNQKLGRLFFVILFVIVLFLRFVFSTADYPFIYVSPLHIDSFLFGMIIGFGYLDRFFKRINPKLKFCLIIVLGFCLYFLPNRYISGVSNTYLYFVVAILCCLVFDLLVNVNTVIKRFLQSPILAYLGKISFGLYIYHIIVIAYMNIIYDRILNSRNWSMEFFVTLLFTILISIISYEFFEKRFLILKRKFTIVRARD